MITTETGERGFTAKELPIQTEKLKRIFIIVLKRLPKLMLLDYTDIRGISRKRDQSVYLESELREICKSFMDRYDNGDRLILMETYSDLKKLLDFLNKG